MTADDRDFFVRMADWESDREALRAIRRAVFVVEQRVPESLEWDGEDAGCRHAIAFDRHGGAIGCGRLLPDGHIGRMAVLAPWRDQGVGAALLDRLIDEAKLAGHRRLLLNAQVRALPFYARRGFVAFGPEFVEAAIPHRAMALDLG